MQPGIRTEHKRVLLKIARTEGIADGVVLCTMDAQESMANNALGEDEKTKWIGHLSWRITLGCAQWAKKNLMELWRERRKAPEQIRDKPCLIGLGLKRNIVYNCNYFAFHGSETRAGIIFIILLLLSSHTFKRIVIVLSVVIYFLWVWRLSVAPIIIETLYSPLRSFVTK